MQKIARMVAVNERGLAIGESHPRAVLTDHEVGLLLELREEGKSMGWLAEKFEVSKSCVAKIVWGQRRAQFAARWVRRDAGPKVNLAPPGNSLCMDKLHHGVNMALPKFSRIEVRPKVWVCMRCARRVRASS